MKHTIIYGFLILFTQFQLAALDVDTEDWDLVQAYQSSTHIFYGELSKSLPIRNFNTGVMGVNLQNISSIDLSMEPIVWPKSKEFVFSIIESFKGTFAEPFVAILPEPDPKLWPYIEDDSGDVFLCRPETVNSQLQGLQSGAVGLFFVRHFSNSKTLVLYRARFGKRAQDDLALLRQFQAAGGTLTLEQIRERVRNQQRAAAEHEATAFRIFEDEYYKILRIQDLDIRVSLLKDLVARLGYDGRWTYFGYKERYMKRHGAYLEKGVQPPGPTKGREKLWHDISGELDKIEAIQKARQFRRQ